MAQHGGNIYKVAQELSCDAKEIIDFSSNINPYNTQQTFCIDAQELKPYPDPNYTQLKKKIATHYAIKPNNIALFNGATSAIDHLFQTRKEKRVYLYAPLYAEYEVSALRAKKDIYKINRIEDIDQEIEKKSIVVFVNPSTPEGSYYDLDELFLEWKLKKCTIIIDESFIEFEGHKSLKKHIGDYKKLYIIHSFSKFYGSAGVRIGAIFTHKKNIDTLTPPLWSIATFDQNFLMQRLDDSHFIEQSKIMHTKNKAQLLSILKQSNLFQTIVESDANFILVQSTQASAIYEHLLQHKILVRQCDTFDFLDASWLRFGVKTAYEHEKLKSALSTMA